MAMRQRIVLERIFDIFGRRFIFTIFFSATNGNSTKDLKADTIRSETESHSENKENDIILASTNYGKVK